MGRARKGRRVQEWGGVVKVEESDGAALAPSVQVFAEVCARTEAQARKALVKLVSHTFGCAGRPEILGISKICDGSIMDQSLLNFDMDGWIDEHGDVVDMGGDLVALPNVPPPHSTPKATGQHIIPFSQGARPAPAQSSYMVPTSLVFPFPDEVIEQIGYSIKEYEVVRT